MMMADMGVPVDFDSKTRYSKFPRPFARFKAAGYAIIAILRFQFLRRKKLHYLRNKVSRLSSSCQLETPQSLECISARDRQSPSYSAIGLSTGIQSVLSAPPTRSQAHPSCHPQLSSSSPLVRDALSSRGGSTIPVTSPATQQLLSTDSSFLKPKLSSGQRSTGLKHTQASSPGRSKFSVKASPASASGVTHGASTTTEPVQQDPHLMAYIKGLERLQARLSKTKL